MLQTSKTQLAPYREAEFPVAESASAAELFELAVRFVRRRLLLITFVALLASALGAAVVLKVLPARYVATATMMIDTRKYQMFQHPSVVGDTPIDSPGVESQLEILRSEGIAVGVIRKLHLADDPDFVRTGPGKIGRVLQLIGVTQPPPPLTAFERERKALDVFQTNLTARRIGPTYVIEVSFKAASAERAAEVANAVAEAYIDDQMEGKFQATRRASDWLQGRLRELNDQAQTAQRAVVEYKSKNNIVDAGNGRLMGEQQVADLNSQLAIARARTAEARARLERTEAIVRADASEAVVSAAVTDLVKNDVVTRLRTQYLELANREAEWSQRYGRNHLAAVNLRNQMREIRTSMRDELNRVLETQKGEFDIARQREEGIERDLAGAVAVNATTNQAQVTLRELESSAQTYRTLYDHFLQRYTESVQQQSFQVTEARLITRATPPNEMTYKKTMVALAVVPFASLMLGLGLAFFRELMDRVFRTGAQLEEALQVNCLALVPRLKPAEIRGGGPRGDAATLPARTIAHGASPAWAVVDQPFSRFAEGMRSIKLAADLNGVVKSNRIIGFTSALPDEGKSTMAASLALIIAQAGSRVVLVDCDLRNPSLSRALAPGANAGILDVISGKAALEDVVWTERATNLDVLPTVVKSRVAHSNEILAADQTKRLFDRLRQSYDYVIVDLSPLAPIVDVRATTHLMDTYVFVVEWGRTRIDVVERALRSAPGVYENLLGAVLNKTDFRVLSRYDSRLAEYYGNKRYGKYGYVD
jgi:succinoglycan biosynthesis transport protein ExoP